MIWNHRKVSKQKAVLWHSRTIKNPTQGWNSAIFQFPLSSTTKKLSIEILIFDGRILVCSYGEKWFRISRWNKNQLFFWFLRTIRIPTQRKKWTTSQHTTGTKVKILRFRPSLKKISPYVRREILWISGIQINPHFGICRLSEFWPKAKKLDYWKYSSSTSEFFPMETLWKVIQDVDTD